MIYGHNIISDTLSIILVSSLFILNIKKDDFIFSYFALIFFEPILVLPFVGGSFFKIYHAIFIIRLIIDAINNKRYKINFKINIIAAFVFLLTSFLYIEDVNVIISSIMNILILLYIVIVYLNKEKNEASYNKILAVIGIFATLSGIYGILFISGINYGYTMRFGATIGDPNYSSLFYTLGLFALIGTNAIGKKLITVLIVILCISLLLTISISGIVGTILLFVIYFGIKKMSKGVLSAASIFAVFLVFMNICYVRGTALYGLKYRILSIINSDNLGIITSNRSELAVYYLRTFFDMPIGKQLFGGTSTITGEFRNRMVSLVGNVSHNSYIDMLYMIGIIGTIVIVIIFLAMIVKNIKQYRCSKKRVYLSVAFLKLTVLYYSISLSIFPFRYFYTVFII